MFVFEILLKNAKQNIYLIAYTIIMLLEGKGSGYRLSGILFYFTEFLLNCLTSFCEEIDYA